MNVGEICTKSAITVSPVTSLDEVARLMVAEDIGTVVVTKSPLDAPVVVGIVTDRDIVRAQFRRAAPLAALHAEDAMTLDPLVVSEGESIATAIGQMQARRVRRAPVIDARGRLSGLVSADDLLAQVSGELTDLARLVAGHAREAHR